MKSISASAQAALAVLQKFPKSDASYSYGTAGFRFEVDEFSPLVFVRTGMVAYFRSCFLGGKTVGLCITASHNMFKDNGVKLIDPDGGMLSQSWEQFATEVVNAPTNEECIRLLESVCIPSPPSLGKILLARDTRPSSELLEQCAMEGIRAWGGNCQSLGLATTPQLHYCVMETNRIGICKNRPPTLEGYEDVLLSSYQALIDTQSEKMKTDLAIDCSNGIGGLRFASLAKQVNFRLFNTQVEVSSELNHLCGAEFVQKNQKPPMNLPVEGNAFASFDGDADRVICFYTQPRFQLLDGDKISSLFALFLSKCMTALNLPCKMGCIQTAYANGSSTKYLSSLVEVKIVKTGVKYLHHEAQRYDVGIYFEANGHGTVLFQPRFVERIQELPPSLPQKQILACVNLLNQATGDACADVLAIDAVLKILRMDFFQWNQLYTDLPSKQCKVPVSDRTLFTVNEDETRCIEPKQIQPLLDQAAQRVEQGRVFVRPSGTENVIRVYAEAKTQADADYLAHQAEEAILSCCSPEKRARLHE